ncbi:hypothetical protein CCR75_003185 [Bremia lactucae]|uniref:Uncharacterized protein n=1 Tax=Bremia lactucae TaxID=4779 RepID=A0A976IF43_BRELC|nr:hypothetical protein CCR75_003185 [Bremia lactucae]
MLRGLRERYANADRHRQMMLYDYALAAPDSAFRDPVLVWTRGRPAGISQRNLSRFEHIAMD